MKSRSHESSLDITELIHIETDLVKPDIQATTSAIKTNNVLVPLIYNQDEERNVSNASTLSSIICVVAGTGILAIAHALSRSGWIGLFFLISSAFMSQFTGIILIKCLYGVQHDRLKDYADIGLAAFGKPGQIIGYLFSQSMLFLTPTIYIILASQNISDILTYYGFIWLNTKTCIWIIAVIIGIPFILVRNMKDVSFLSTFASMATVCLLLAVCVASMANFNEQTELVHHDFAIPRKIPIAFSTFSFSYCGHVIYPHLEASMITPKRWSKVLLVATCVISIMYLTMGAVCYFVFGDTAQSPIYKSLSTGPSQHVAMFVITIHVLLVAPFYLYVFTTRIELWLGIAISQDNRVDLEEERKSKLMRILLRIGQVILCGVIAMFIPFFSDFMNLVGTILSDTLTFILPCVFWLKLNWRNSQRNTVYYVEAIACLTVAIIGTCCATFGTIDAVKALIHDYTLLNY
ncbi:transmembrane amino acid transporter protein-domain-containing protein [Thamnidium elegans]|nr:transmembrane amino acid transporter protein-domain-containing protein [Thamnidium elegans]